MQKKYLLLAVFLVTVMVTVLILLLLSGEPASTPENLPEEEKEEEQEQELETNKRPSLEELLKEAEVREEGEEGIATLEENNPLVRHIPYRSPNREFEIHFKIVDEANSEVAYPIILRPSGAAGTQEYETDVERLKEAALNWISSVGVDPQTVDIEWRIE